MSIFVSIPSYRDSECQFTIQSLFEQAFNPDKIFVGICWQFDENEDKLCFQVETRPDQVKTVNMHYNEAKGPIYARYHAQTLFNNEEYYLQIDSHMRFIRHWDKQLIEWLEKCEETAEKPILTTYPLSYELPNEIPDDKRPPMLVATHFGEDNMLRVKGSTLSDFLKEPVQSYFWVAGFSFSRANILKEVPYDPNLEYLFFGEEPGMMLRLYTHGYQFFSPPKTVLYHLYDRSYRPNFRQGESEKTKKKETKSRNIIDFLISNQNQNLQILKDQKKIPKNWDPELYGLGNTKSIEDFQNFCGVDFEKKIIQERSKYGGLEKNLFSDVKMEELLEKISLLSNNQAFLG